MRLGRGWAAGLAQLERDVRALGRRLAGGHPPPLVTRTRRAAALASDTSSPSSTSLTSNPSNTAHAEPRELVVTRTVIEARGVVTLVLEAPSRAPFEFSPGQFFTVLASIDGQVVPRNYSASNAPGSAELHLTIKAKPGGRVSGTLVAARAGDRLRVLGPFGSFTVTPSPASSRSLVLVAGGVGITPLMSIARGVLASEPESRVALVYGNRTREDVAFAAELDALVAAHGDRLRVRHLLEAPHPGFDAAVGRLDRDTVTRILRDLAPGPSSYYVCGPDGMREQVLAALTGERVHFERFTVSRAGRGSDVAGSSPHAITVRVRGEEYRGDAPAGATLLEAGRAAGAPMPSSCSLGGCGACRVKLVSGDVELEEPNCLGADERRSGYVLACVGRPRTACTVVVED